MERKLSEGRERRGSSRHGEDGACSAEPECPCLLRGAVSSDSWGQTGGQGSQRGPRGVTFCQRPGGAGSAASRTRAAMQGPAPCLAVLPCAREGQGFRGPEHHRHWAPIQAPPDHVVSLLQARVPSICRAKAEPTLPTPAHLCLFHVPASGATTTTTAA